MRIVLRDKYIEADGWYIGRAQARRIVSGKATKAHCEGHRFGLGGHTVDCRMTADIREHKKSSIKIGCALIRKSQLDRVRRWLKGSK